MGFFDNYKKIKDKQNNMTHHDLKAVIPDLTLYRIFQNFNDSNIIDFKKMDSSDYDEQYNTCIELGTMLCRMMSKSFEINLENNSNARKTENAASCIRFFIEQYKQNYTTTKFTTTDLEIAFPFYLFSYFFKSNSVPDNKPLYFPDDYCSFSMLSFEINPTIKKWKFCYNFKEENTCFHLNNHILAKKFGKNHVPASDKEWLIKNELLCSAYAFYNRCFKDFTLKRRKMEKELIFDRKYFIPTMMKLDRDYLDEKKDMSPLSSAGKKVLGELWNANDTTKKQHDYQINLFGWQKNTDNVFTPDTEVTINSKDITSEIIMESVAKVAKMNNYRTCTNYCRLKNLVCYIETFFSFTGLKSTPDKESENSKNFYFPNLLLDYYLDKDNLLSYREHCNFHEWTDSIYTSVHQTTLLSQYGLYGTGNKMDDYMKQHAAVEKIKTNLKAEDLVTFTFHYNDPWHPQKENLEILEGLLKDNDLLFDSMESFIKNSPDMPRKNILIKRKKNAKNNNRKYDAYVMDSVLIDVPYFEKFEKFNIKALYDRFEFHKPLIH